jgi:hypothetical protein
MTTEPTSAHEAAVALAAALRDGWRFEPMAPTIALQPDEQQLMGMPVMIGVYAKEEGRPGRLPFFVWGTPALAAATVMGAHAYNQAEQRRATAQNRPQWRIVDRGTLHVTDRRLAVQGTMAWQDIAYADLRMVEQQPDGVVLHLPDRSPGKLIVDGPGNLSVAVNHLAFGRVVDPSEPVEVPVDDVQPPTQPPGWFPDPLGRHEFRYWGGTEWTEHVSDGATTQSDPISPT